MTLDESQKATKFEEIESNSQKAMPRDGSQEMIKT